MQSFFLKFRGEVQNAGPVRGEKCKMVSRQSNGGGGGGGKTGNGNYVPTQNGWFYKPAPPPICLCATPAIWSGHHRTTQSSIRRGIISYILFRSREETSHRSAVAEYEKRWGMGEATFLPDTIGRMGACYVCGWWGVVVPCPSQLYSFDYEHL